MNSSEKLLEQIAADVVLLELDNLPALAQLHETFLELAEALKDGPEMLSDVAKSCGNAVEKIILNQVDDKESAMSSLTAAVEALQGVIRDHRELSEVQFPPEFIQTANSEGQSASETTSEGLAEEETAADESMSMNFEDVDISLLGEFVTEAREHCLVAEQMMMDLETAEDGEAAVNSIFRGFHTIKGAAGFLDLPPISLVAHESETLLDLARKGTVLIRGEIADIIFEAIDTLRQLLDAVEEGLNSGDSFDAHPVISNVLEALRRINSDPSKASVASDGERVGDLLVDMGAVSQSQIDEALAKKGSKDKLGETLVKQGVVPAKSVAQALRLQKKISDKKPKLTASAVKDVVKIDTVRLDLLVDTIGELVIAESMVGQDEEFLALASPRVSKNISHLNKITRELQEMGMAMRLVPVRPTFQKLARAVRDLSRKSGKKIELIMTGEETEVDRSIVENISDPLMHMIRNAVDHAIEMPEDRIKAGKPETGRVWLRAYHKGGKIHFGIEDDGRGLDKEGILAKAREKKLIDANREMTEKEIFNLIFHPGFSTAKEVTDVSGRGVGMDVVKKNIETMRGSIEIESEAHKGSCFTMKLPLTLAIIDGMLVRIGPERYIIPTVSVVESMHLVDGMISTINGDKEMINLRGNMLPLISTGRLLGLSSRSEKAVDGVVVVVEDGDKRVGLVVDELLGQRQTVIKGLGPVFSSQKWASGAAILSNGHVGLIIDVAGIVGLTGRTHMVLPKPTESEPTESEPTESELTESEPTESEPAADLIPQLEAVLSD
jgi:two-component system chemotaxis sensor kinase CheA